MVEWCQETMTRKNNIVKKHTILPLYGFESSFSSDIDLGQGYFIAKLPETILGNFLEYGKLWDKTGETKALDFFERDRFLTTFCINHRYEGPESPHLSAPEAESGETVRRITQACQLVKFTMSSPEFIIQTQGDNYKVINAIKTHERNFIPDTKELILQPFRDEDIKSIIALWPRIKDLYLKHKRKFNRIANALEFFRVGLNMTAYQLRFVLFVIVLESIYSTSNIEVAYALSQRLAWFLGKDSRERMDYFGTAKKCYKIRSRIVHGTTVKGNLKAEINNLMVKIEDMTRKSLCKILLENGLLKIFLDMDKLKDYFDSLTLDSGEK